MAGALMFVRSGGAAPENRQARADLAVEENARAGEAIVELEVEGWQLVGDWLQPSSEGPFPPRSS
ncbi:MAG TPA: hypothetical protein VIG29_11635 [Vicinamibacteria bacterium]